MLAEIWGLFKKAKATGRVETDSTMIEIDGKTQPFWVQISPQAYGNAIVVFSRADLEYARKFHGGKADALSAKEFARNLAKFKNSLKREN